jgi:hypothetical protein
VLALQYQLEIHREEGDLHLTLDLEQTPPIKVLIQQRLENLVQSLLVVTNIRSVHHTDTFHVDRFQLLDRNV